MAVRPDQIARPMADRTVPPPKAMTLSVVIPVLNEEDGIAEIIGRVSSARAGLARAGIEGLEIIVVDDGSQDRTADIVATFESVTLLRHPTNRGYGAAIKTGFGNARGELLAFLDADGTYPPEHFPQLCEVALAQGADVVVGSRRSGAASQMPPLRRLGNLLWSSLVSVMGNQRVQDPASGMRVIRRERLARLYPLPDGLNFTPVMSTRAVHEGLRVVEVPIPYAERLGRSKLSVVRDGSRFLSTILWTALEYNPVRVLGLASALLLGMAGLIGLGVLALRLQGVTALGPWGIFALFSALVLGVAGGSLLGLGSTFTTLVALFHRRPMQQGLLGRPLFAVPLDRHFGWVGLLLGLGGTAVALGSLALSLRGWDLTRLWFWLLVSAMAVLIGLQLLSSWLLMRVLAALSQRDALIEEAMAVQS